MKRSRFSLKNLRRRGGGCMIEVGKISEEQELTLGNLCSLKRQNS